MERFALVTGAASGIGQATARALVDAGWHVALTGRNLGALRAVASDLGENTLAIACDVRDRESVRALFATVARQFGRLDLVFNNAGIVGDGRAFEDIPEEQVTSVLNTNVAGVFYCSQEAFALMKNQDPPGGRIINNGSISAHVPRPNSALYTASKHAVTGITRSLALDGRTLGIACGQIDVGNADTAMASNQREGIIQSNGSIMAEPMIDPRHIADAVVYMAGLPLDTNVPFITVMATGMPYMGRG